MYLMWFLKKLLLYSNDTTILSWKHWDSWRKLPSTQPISSHRFWLGTSGTILFHLVPYCKKSAACNSPLLHPSLLVMSLPKDPPPLVHLSPPQLLCQKLPDTFQYKNQVQDPAHLCSSANRDMLISHKCTLSVHKTRHILLPFCSEWGLFLDDDTGYDSRTSNVHSEMIRFPVACWTGQLHLHKITAKLTHL